MKELKELRKTLGLTQEQMAKEINVSRQLIMMIENGKRKPSTGFIKNLKEKYSFIDIYIFLK